MYVCHCNRIPERDILAAIAQVQLRRLPDRPTPADVLGELGRQGKCLGCFPLIANLMDAFGRGGVLQASAVPVNADQLSETANDPVTHRMAHSTVSTTDAVGRKTSSRRQRRGGAFARRQGM